jgi:hypothetical protein
MASTFSANLRLNKTRTGNFLMNDLIFAGISVGFFALAVAYAYFCEKVE